MPKITLLLNITLLGAMVGAVGCAAPRDADKAASAATSDYEAVYEAAQAAREKAASVGNEWRDTSMILAQSKKANDGGDHETAIKLANQAKAQGELGYAQAQKNKEFLKKVEFYNPDATPQEDLEKLQGFFHKKFPKLPKEEFANGFYAMDPVMRENWEAIEEFPPYEPAIEQGKTLWNAAFKNGKTYEDCFGGADVVNEYPKWDRKAGEVLTLSMAINACREKNGEMPLKYSKDEVLAIQAYMAYQSRGKPTNVVVPEDDPRALEAYEKGKVFYFSRRGQLNLACFQCHFYTAGQKIRTNVLGPALGQTTHWPTYRSKWGSMGSIHRRYKGCNKQVRAKPFDFQSEEYRNLEFFHTHMSNGIPLNGPGSRF